MTSKETHNNLVALGTAVVIAIYAAGFVHTRAAAAAAAEADLDPQATEQTVSAPPNAPRVTATTGMPGATAGANTASIASAPSPANPTPSKRAAADTASGPPPVPDTAAATAVAPLSVSTPPPIVAPPVDSSHAVTVGAAPDTTPKLVMPAEHYRDGFYKGYGTSRHGDILVGVRITDGRIVDAYITVCATEYSCDLISALPDQVIERQGIRVDRVSGATNSVSAFTKAIADALTKAK